MPMDEGPCMFCPLCRQICDLPSNGVDGLPDNHLLRSLLDTINSKVRQACDVCKDEGKRRKAGYVCIKCEDFLCDDCAVMHKKTRITKDHLVINISSIKDILPGLEESDNKGSLVFVRLMTKFGCHGDDLNHPISVCTNRADDIIISNSNSIISVFSQTGACKKTIDQRIFYGLEKNALQNRCVSMTAEGFLVVAMRKDITSSHAHVAVIESMAAREISVLSQKTRHPHDVMPHGIVVTNNNHFVVTDIGKHCVYVYDSEYQLVKQFGKKGSRSKQFKYPQYVTVNFRNDILVSDYGNHCIKMFDFKGKLKLQFGSMGKELGQLMHPVGICCDKYGNTFVADRDNHRVQMFNIHGSYFATILSDTCSEGHDVRPQDVAITTNGHLVVLLTGIEGVDFAQVHIYQYGPSRLRRQGRKVTQVCSRADLATPMPSQLRGRGKLPPLCRNAIATGDHDGYMEMDPTAPPFADLKNIPPDLLRHGTHRAAGAEGGNGADGKGFDPNSTVCVIL